MKQFLFLIFPLASVFGDGILQVVQFLKRMFDVLLADRFQQIVDTVHFEGTQGIFVVSRGEDNGAGDADMIEYFEGRTVCQMNIHKNVALDEPDSPVLYVEGADLMNGTPIFDIKPYIPYADCHPEATGSFTEYSKDHHLNVEFPQELLERIPGESREALIAVLADDPRPAYQNDPERSYGMPFGEKDIHFRVDGDILRVYNVTEFVKKQQESSADCGK